MHWTVKQLDIWVPLEFKKFYLTQGTNIGDMHLKHNEIDIFFKKIHHC